MEEITSDCVVEINDPKQNRYKTSVTNRKKGKAIKKQMLNLGWTFSGEIQKTVKSTGKRTTVAKYTR